MCGRYTIHIPMEGLASRFDLENAIAYTPTYNAAPGQDLPVIIKNRIGLARWGFVPAWANAKDIKPQINARLETVASKPMFADAFKKRRCLVPATGFYEWAKTDHGKQPYHIHREDGAHFAFAGIWSKIQATEGPQVTFAIVTKPALPAIAGIHARMPVMLDGGTGTSWLYGATDEALAVAHNAEPALASYTVTSRVNSPSEDDAGLIVTE